VPMFNIPSIVVNRVWPELVCQKQQSSSVRLACQGSAWSGGYVDWAAAYLGQLLQAHRGGEGHVTSAADQEVKSEESLNLLRVCTCMFRIPSIRMYPCKQMSVF
jgi:hypothetical protein